MGELQMSRNVMYLRKSRADVEAEAKGEMETLSRHRKALLEVAKRMNISIDKIYEELVSGDTIAARPLMQQLLEEVEEGKWDAVLVMELERLARGDGIDQQLVLNAFKVGNTKIITPIKTYDPNDEYDEEYAEFGLFMSRREYKVIKRRLYRGRVATVKEGKFISSTPPYGYDKVKLQNDKGYSLEPNKQEASIVKLIFDLYIEGKGMTVISNELDRLNIKPRYRDTWSKSTINDILKNPVYIGKVRWAYKIEKKTNIDGEVKKNRKISNDYYYVDGIHKPIIDFDIFEKAQLIRKQNTYKRTKNDLSLKNPLTGLIFCKKCGSVMSRLGENAKNKYDSIRCSNKYCDNISAPLYLVEQYLIDALTDWLNNYEIEINRNNVDNIKKEQIEVKANSIRTLKEEIAIIEKQISQTYDLLERGIYTVEVFSNRNRELSDRKHQLDESIKELEKQVKSDITLTDIKEKYLPQSKSLLNQYYAVDNAEEKNRILKYLINRVEYIKTEPNHRGSLENINFTLDIYPTLQRLNKLPI
jgi:DNA invertase Pin-like site-specific DNA recombinase